MPRVRQQRLAQAIVENIKADKPLPVTKLLESVGYPTSTAESQAKAVIEQKGVQEELERLGFTENKAKEVVAEIMTNSDVEPNARLKAADMTFKVHGSYAPDKSINLNVNADIKQDPKAQAIAQKYEAELLNTITGETQ
jgi:serine/threonine protein kinase HipA of HipAB toxin-antitoxin module